MFIEYFLIMSKQNIMANDIMQCPTCREATEIITDYSQGAVICRNCGLVLETSCIDDSQEWRSFGDSITSAKPDRDRVGSISKSLIGDNASGTSIGVGNGRLGRTQFLAMNDQSADRTLSKAHNLLRDVMRTLGLSDSIYTRCCELLKFLDDTGRLRNRTNHAWILAVVYMACRQERTGRSISELVRAAPTIKEAEVAKNYWRLDKLLAGSTIQQQSNSGTSAQSGDTDNFVLRFCSKLNIQSAEQASAYVAIQAGRFGLAGAKTPNVVAAASVFIVAHLMDLPNKPTWEAIVEVSQAKLPAIKQVYAGIRQPVARLLPPNFQIKQAGGIASLP